MLTADGIGYVITEGAPAPLNIAVSTTRPTNQPGNDFHPTLMGISYLLNPTATVATDVSEPKTPEKFFAPPGYITFFWIYMAITSLRLRPPGPVPWMRRVSTWSLRRTCRRLGSLRFPDSFPWHASAATLWTVTAYVIVNGVPRLPEAWRRQTGRTRELGPVLDAFAPERSQIKPGVHPRWSSRTCGHPATRFMKRRLCSKSKTGVHVKPEPVNCLGAPKRTGLAPTNPSSTAGETSS